MILQNSIENYPKFKNQYTNAMEFIERVFSKELTFFFYLNLNKSFFKTTESYFLAPEDIESKEMDIDDVRLSLKYDILYNGSPKERLTSILQTDKDIKLQFVTWMQMLINYQQETYKKMSESFYRINVKE